MKKYRTRKTKDEILEIIVKEFLDQHEQTVSDGTSDVALNRKNLCREHALADLIHKIGISD